MNRTPVRLLAALAGALVVPVVAASPAFATPEDGKGCAGLPQIPATYVCVISATPENAVPTSTTTTVPVTVPRVCYVADCAGPKTVDVPVPGLTPGSGQVAVIWYKGTYTPIAVGTGTLIPLVNGAVQLATGTVSTVNGLAAGAVTTVQGVVADLPTAAEVQAEVARIVAPYLKTVNDLVATLPTTAQLVAAVNGVLDTVPTTAEILAAVDSALAPYEQQVAELRDQLPTTAELVAAVTRIVNDLRADVEAALAGYEQLVQNAIDNAPSVQELRDGVIEAINRARDRLEPLLADVQELIANVLDALDDEILSL